MNEYNAPNMNYLAPGLAGAQLCPASPDGCCEARDMSQCSSADGWLTQDGHKPGLKCCGILQYSRFFIGLHGKNI